jgi:hypothetical protein
MLLAYLKAVGDNERIGDYSARERKRAKEMSQEKYIKQTTKRLFLCRFLERKRDSCNSSQELHFFPAFQARSKSDQVCASWRHV